MNTPAVVAALFTALSLSIGVTSVFAQDEPSPPPPEDTPTTTPPPVPPEDSPPPAETSETEPTPTDERISAYRTFRENFDAHRYAQALPAAQQVAQLSEQKYGPEQLEVVTPLTNLGATQLRLKDYPAAEVTFLRAVKIVEARAGGFAREIIRPVMGLGVTYAAAGQHEDAVTQLRRAIDVSRRLDGLFNPAQIELVDPLIQSYLALDQLTDMEREQQYMMRLAESAYGRDDLRTLPTLNRNAYWYEQAGRYYSARVQRYRAVDLLYRDNRKKGEAAQKKEGAKEHKPGKDPYEDIRMVEQLRGIARAYRLEYLYGLESRDTESEPKNPTEVGTTMMSTTVRLEDNGRRVLERALIILKDDPAATAQLRGETRLDMGDWYLAAGDKRSAFATYKEAWADLTGEGGGGAALLSEPAQVVYRGPSGSLPRPPVPIEAFDTHYVEAQFKVNKEGEVLDVSVAQSDATESQKKAVMTAVDRAKYRPRFVDGEPADAENVRFRQVLYTKKKKEKEEEKT